MECVMVRTSLSDSARSRSSKGRAIHGIVPKYSLNWSSSRSAEQKTISKSERAALIFLYVSASFGVKLRHGPHQCAEK